MAIIEQLELDTMMEADSIARDSVRGVIKAMTDTFRQKISARTGYEAYGQLAEAEMKLKAISKTLKKEMSVLLETLDSGVDTPMELMKTVSIAEEMAQEAILMAMKGKICVDWLTFQERVMKDVDPETGEIRR